MREVTRLTLISSSRTVVVLARLDHLVGAGTVFHGFVRVRQANRQATQPEIHSETSGRRGLGWWAAMHGLIQCMFYV
jgi:hypothetical protein